MSLYGDLPPPSNDGDKTPNKESSLASSSSATNVKPVLPGIVVYHFYSKSREIPAKYHFNDSCIYHSYFTKPAAWAASVTRFKPMLNRKLAPPKPKPAQRSIPAGFVAQSTVITTLSPSTSAPLARGDYNSPSAMPLAEVDTSSSTKKAETTLDDNSWLKARTAQVQRKDNDAQVRQSVL